MKPRPVRVRPKFLQDVDKLLIPIEETKPHKPPPIGAHAIAFLMILISIALLWALVARC
jgi:hypothetical protein